MRLRQPILYGMETETIALAQVEHYGLHVECSWCKDVLREGDRAQPVSHGICPPCLKAFRIQMMGHP